MHCPKGHPRTPENTYANGRCRPCGRAHCKARYQAKKPAYVARAAKWKKANPAKSRASIKAWHDANPAKVRSARLNRNYKITLADYEKLLTKQRGRCAICGTKTPGCGWTSFPVDHDHETGKVRGLLCQSCNKGLGNFKDDIQNLRRAIDYLEDS
jgi:hypothetical protein